MINIKVQKLNSANNAVAAINILHNDYVENDPEQEKSYLILKTIYNFVQSKKDSERKILIKDIDSYCLEEIDFSNGHKQDHRNWSASFNSNSGRLQIPSSWRKNNILDSHNISYMKTKRFIEDIYSGNNPEI